MVSDQVRRMIMDTSAESEKQKIHARLIEHFTARPVDTVGYFELMSFHYEQLGRARDSLLMRVRAVALARRTQDVFALRRLCERGLEYVRGLDGDEWDAHKWPVERYFIKQWIDAEFVAANFRNLVNVVKDHVVGRGHEVPFSFLYKYSMALERAGEADECKRILAEGKEKLASGKSETYYMLLLQEGRMLCHAGLSAESLERLDKIEPDALSPGARGRLYVTYIHDFQDLGREESWRSYANKADALPQDATLIDQLLRVEYSRIRQLLLRGVYSSTKKMIGQSIRRASKHKAYRSLCSMYFMASNLYYEMGDYQRAMKYLDRTIRVGKQRVFPEWIHEWTLRYAYIYQKLGLYGNAIELAEGVVRAASADRGHQQYFTSLTALLSNLVMINSHRANEILPELMRASQIVQDRFRLALYHRALGRYFAKNSNIARAIEEFEHARKLFAMIGMADEEVAAVTSIAALLISQKRFHEARALIAEMRTVVSSTESKEMLAKYSTVELSLRVAEGEDRTQIKDLALRCESIGAEISDVGVAMNLDAALFGAAVALNELEGASTVFDRYYRCARRIASNLPKEYVADFINDPQLTSLVERFRFLKTADPGQR
jgi:tetratricopeptide (TPR) repeat protein